MQLTRSNDDPKLLGDLGRLAGQPASVVVEDGPAAADEAVPEASPFDDAFVRRFVQVSTHVRRYAPFYAGAAMWFLAMVLIQPVGGGGGAGPETASSADFASANSTVSSSSVTETVSAVPAAAVDGFGLSGSFVVSSYASPSPSPSSPAASSPSAATEPAPPGLPDPVDSLNMGDDVVPVVALSILESGYASAAGGTPAEQSPPGNGLPVAAVGGNDAKRSFVRLSGTETTLRLKAIAGSMDQVTTYQAAVKACVITTADWVPRRGQKLDAGPAYDLSQCATGVAGAGGVWTFDLGYFGSVSAGNGFALVPGAGTVPSFEITFEPRAFAG
ncbi:MAG: hypothetical protein QOF60_3225 [Actinomycetota bacterium]|nr:hypothetical protein [Actinomycetota bacterium]